MIAFLHRSDTSRSELAELSKQANPDEIDIDDDDDDDDNQGPDGDWQTHQIWCLKMYCQHVLFTRRLSVISEVQLEQKTVPAAVFGGLKDD